MQRELISLKEARERLGLSKTTMTRVVRHRGFTLYENPLDRREKLVDWVEVNTAMQPRAFVKEDTKKATGWISSHAA